MSENVMTLQVITPAGMIYDHHANYITARTTNGEIGILPNMISTIALRCLKHLSISIRIMITL